MDDFKWGEEVEVREEFYGDWHGFYKYGCLAPNSKDHIVFKIDEKNTARSTRIYSDVRRPRPDLKIDDKLWVRKDVKSSNGKWLKRHFAGWDEKTGKMMAFGNGTTSWSAEDTRNEAFVFEEYSLTDPESK